VQEEEAESERGVQFGTDKEAKVEAQGVFSSEFAITNAL